jgi:hypothetical protein
VWKVFWVAYTPKKYLYGPGKPYKIIKDRWTMGINDEFAYELHLKRIGGVGGVQRVFVLERAT